MTNTSPTWLAILKGFGAQHPGVTIKNNFVAFAQYLPTLTSMAAAKTLPDVFFAHVEAAVLGRAGLTINYKDYLPASFFKQFYGGPIGQFTFNGKIYALPENAQIFGLFVDTPIMQKLGLPVPQTWSQLIAEAPKIRAAGYTPLAWGNQAGNVCPDFVLPLITQEGGNVPALDDLTKPGLTWNSPPVIKALALLQSLAKAHVFMDGINGVSENQGWVYAWHDKAAMLFTGSWVPPTIDQQAPSSYAKTYTVAKLPTVSVGERHWSGDGSGQGFAINAHSPNKALAIEFIKYLFSSSVYPTFIKATQEFPSLPSALPQVSNPKVKQMIGWVAEGDGADHILFGNGSWNAISNACSAILGGSSATPQALAAQIENQVLATRKH
jgi:raffinose/stachyose/melibiose transport system substrate-binding protein